MALLFSKVRVTIEGSQEEKSFLAFGIPNCYEDLEIYCAMDEILDEIEEETKLSVHTESYLYGEGEHYAATFEELAYMDMRMSDDELFLENHCRKIGEGHFEIEYAPCELFDTIMGFLEC